MVDSVLGERTNSVHPQLIAVKDDLVEAAANAERAAQNRPPVCVLHKQSLVEAAGIEPCEAQNTNLMM